jgi:membrane protein implicated in regulation of membrane protease activity
MTGWMMWVTLAAILVILEMFTGTFYLLMIAIGLAMGALAALAGMTLETQILVAAGVGVLATGILHRSRLGAAPKTESARDPNVNIDIGQDVTVNGWDNGKARVMYRGAPWDVELSPGAQPEAGNFRIVAVHGSRLVVANA